MTQCSTVVSEVEEMKQKIKDAVSEFISKTNVLPGIGITIISEETLKGVVHSIRVEVQFSL